MKFNTKVIHGGQENADPAYGSVMPPIYQTSTYSQTTPGAHKGYEYSRSGNPTRTALERAFASIENGNYGLAFSRSEERRVGKECGFEMMSAYASRRRHTRWPRDWSSDVCSSDLRKCRSGIWICYASYLSDLNIFSNHSRST